MSQGDAEIGLSGSEVSKDASARGTSRSAQGEDDHPKGARVAYPALKHRAIIGSPCGTLLPGHPAPER